MKKAPHENYLVILFLLVIYLFLITAINCIHLSITGFPSASSRCLIHSQSTLFTPLDRDIKSRDETIRSAYEAKFDSSSDDKDMDMAGLTEYGFIYM